MSRQDKYTKSARGQDCLVRIPGVCNHNPETVVLAHLNGGGMSMKHQNIHGSYCCSDCHDVVDSRAKSSYSKEEIKLMLLEGMVRTQTLMIKNGILKL